MIGVAEARELILGRCEPLGVEHAPLREALRRTLREDVVADRPHPPFRASAMDGYAVRAADTPGVLRLVGEAGAGRSLARTLGAGESARIFTGAALPEGADAVLIQEDAARDGDLVTAPHVEPGRHVRGPGVDFNTGETLLRAGRVLDAPAIALAAAAGRPSLRVSARPRVMVLGGGDELVSPGAAPAPDQIFDSVSFGIAALAETWGAEASAAPPLADDKARIANALADAVAAHDLAVIIGGASVGDHDHARPAVRALGGEVLFDKVAVRPGKPTWFALLNGKLVLGLPGNPASAFVCARLFLRPLLDRLCGRDAEDAARLIHVRTRTPLAANGPRQTYLRTWVSADETGQNWAVTPPNQDSSLLSVIAGANALIVRAPNAPEAAPGSLAPAIAL